MEWVSDLATSALIIALIFLILCRQDKRMDDQETRVGDVVKKIDAQPSREYCDLQHKTVEKKFDSGNERFEKLETKIDGLQSTISNVDTNVAILLDRDEHEDK